MTIDTSHAEPGAEPSANPVADRATDADTIEAGRRRWQQRYDADEAAGRTSPRCPVWRWTRSTARRPVTP